MKGLDKILSNTRIGSVDDGARSRFGLLGRLCVYASVVLTVGIGCGSDASNPGTKTNGQSGSCGNGAIDSGEDCDGTSLGTASCMSVTNGAYPIGSIACDPTTC